MKIFLSCVWMKLTKICLFLRKNKKCWFLIKMLKEKCFAVRVFMINILFEWMKKATLHKWFNSQLYLFVNSCMNFIMFVMIVFIIFYLFFQVWKIKQLKFWMIIVTEQYICIWKVIVLLNIIQSWAMLLMILICLINFVIYVDLK